TRERTTVRAPRRDVGPRSVNSALGEPAPKNAARRLARFFVRPSALVEEAAHRAREARGLEGLGDERGPRLPERLVVGEARHEEDGDAGQARAHDDRNTSG